MAVILDIDAEAGNTSEFTSVTTGGTSTFAAATSAAQAGTTYGFKVTADGIYYTYGKADFTAFTGTEHRFRIYFDASAYTTGNFILLYPVFLQNSGAYASALVFTNNSNVLTIAGRTYNNSAASVDTAFYSFNNTIPHYAEVHVVRHASAGSVSLYLDGVLKETKGSIANNTATQPASALLGKTINYSKTPGQVLEIDQFILRDDGTEIGPHLTDVDLSMTLVPDDSTPSVGTNVVLTATCSNAAGFLDATNVVAEVVMPSGLTYVSDDGGGSTSESGGVVTWTIGSITSGTSATALAVTATVLGTGSYVPYAEVVSATETDVDSTYDDQAGDDYAATTLVPVSVVDLSMTFTPDDSTPDVGSNVVLTATCSNAAGFTNATNVVAQVYLPSGLSYVSDNGGGSYVSSTGVWTIGSITSGTSATALQVTAKVLGTGTYTPYAEVDSCDQNDTDSTYNDQAGDDYAAAALTPNALVDLSMTLTPDDSTPDVGSNVVLTATCSNAADFTNATNVVGQVLLPSGLSYISDDGGGSYVSSTGVWTIGSITAGTSATALQITAKVLGTGTYTPYAEVDSCDQTDVDSTYNDQAGDDYAAAALTPNARIDLTTTMFSSTSTPLIDTDFTMTVRVTNAADYTTATGVTVLIPIPTDCIWISDSPDEYDQVTTKLWTVASLPGGSMEEIIITFQGTTTGVKAFTAEVAAADQTDSTSTWGDLAGDDYASVSVNIKAVTSGGSPLRFYEG